MLLTLLTYETRLLSFRKLRESYQFFIPFAPHAATFSSATLMHIFFRGISRIVSCPIGILPKKHLLRAPATDPPIHYNKITSKKTARKHKKMAADIKSDCHNLCHVIDAPFSFRRLRMLSGASINCFVLIYDFLGE